MNYQPRSTNPYIMEKKLNECVGGGGLDPSVLEEIEAEISVLGSENATMAQDIIDIKGSLNSINDNLNKHTISEDTKVTLTFNTEYTTLADGYAKITSTPGASGYNYARLYIDGVEILRVHDMEAGGLSSLFVRKGSKIKFNGSSDTTTTGYFYPLS